MARKTNYILLGKFKKLKVGSKVVVRYMTGDAYIAGEPSYNELTDHFGDTIKRECVDVRFTSGPWKGKTLNLIRQQISTISTAFPDRKKH